MRSQSSVPKWKTHTDCHVCISPHTHTWIVFLNGTILNDSGLQTTYSKRILNGFALHFCHRSASDLFPIFPHSTSNQKVFQTSVPLRNGCFLHFAKPIIIHLNALSWLFVTKVFLTEIRCAIGQDVLKSHFPAMLILIMFEGMLHISR